MVPYIVVLCAYSQFSLQFTGYAVFISYRHIDSKVFAEKLEKYLKLKNKMVFRDENEIVAGQNITEECKRAIRVSQVFVPIFSMHYCEGLSEDEFLYNKDEVKKPVVPVVLKDAIIPRFYKVGGNLQVRIPADYEENEEHYFKRILEGVENAQFPGMKSFLCIQ